MARLPIDVLQIDRSFVHEIDSDADRAAIVIAAIGLAHSLRLRVVAEGVEKESQLALLLAHGCDMMQGFLFSRPLPPEEITELLREGRSLPPAGN